MDPAEGGELEVVDVVAGSFVVGALTTVEPDQAIGLGAVVVAVPDRADAGEGAGVQESFAIADRGVVTGVPSSLWCTTPWVSSPWSFSLNFSNSRSSQSKAMGAAAW